MAGYLLTVSEYILPYILDVAYRNNRKTAKESNHAAEG